MGQQPASGHWAPRSLVQGSLLKHVISGQSKLFGEHGVVGGVQGVWRTYVPLGASTYPLTQHALTAPALVMPAIGLSSLPLIVAASVQVIAEVGPPSPGVLHVAPSGYCTWQNSNKASEQNIFVVQRVMQLVMVYQWHICSIAIDEPNGSSNIPTRKDQQGHCPPSRLLILLLFSQAELPPLQCSRGCSQQTPWLHDQCRQWPCHSLARNIRLKGRHHR